MHSTGARLRTLRHQHGVSLRQLSASTRIPVATLEHLEQERWDALPGEVFIRGFIRSCARALGVDSNQILGAHEGEDSTRQASLPLGLQAMLAPPRRERKLRFIALCVSVIVLCAVATSVMMRSSDTSIPVGITKDARQGQVFIAG